MMKKLLSFLGTAFAVMMLAAGCATERLPAEDIEVLSVCKREIAILQSQEYRPNSKIKYDAAKSLLSKVDFSYTRRVETLDAIFSSVDARVDNPKSQTQTLSFYYQYQNHSILFIFRRYQNFVVSFKVEEK